MTAGGPGDHPLTDVINFNLEIYGAPADELLRELDKLLSRRELHEFWSTEIGWEPAADIAAEKIAKKLEWAKTRAKENGWEQQ